MSIERNKGGVESLEDLLFHKVLTALLEKFQEAREPEVDVGDQLLQLGQILLAVLAVAPQLGDLLPGQVRALLEEVLSQDGRHVGGERDGVGLAPVARVLQQVPHTQLVWTPGEVTDRKSLLPWRLLKERQAVCLCFTGPYLETLQTT